MYTYLDSFILLCLLFRWRKKPTGNCFPLLFWRFFGFALLHIPQCFHKFFTITLGPESKRSKNQLKPSKCSIITRFKTASVFFWSTDWKKFVKMSVDNELSAILNRRQNLNDGLQVAKRSAKVSVYTEFSEFSKKQIKDYQAQFTT